MSNTAQYTHTDMVRIKGAVVFRGRGEKYKCVIQPIEGKRFICKFIDPVTVRVRQILEVEGRVISEGSTTVVLESCSLI